MEIIALSGHKRAGKDAAARALVRDGYARVAFADPVREDIFEMYPQARGIPDAQKEAPQAVLGGKSLRMLLVEHGMGMREKDPDHWVRKAQEKIENLRGQGLRIVVSDVRMDNEIAMLESVGALKVWIDRPGCSPNGHVTERDLRDRADIVVRNAGTEEDLARKMVGILGSFCGACANMRRDASFPRYGFCSEGRTMDEKCRLVQTETECIFRAYKPAPGFVPPTP
jgi:hypothetical protein